MKVALGWAAALLRRCAWTTVRKCEEGDLERVWGDVRSMQVCCLVDLDGYQEIFILSAGRQLLNALPTRAQAKRHERTAACQSTVAQVLSTT